MGAGSNITCGAGVCNFTCNGQCTVGAIGGTANLTCLNGTTQGIAGCN
ncbi:MAG: hypothetical protein WCJ30_07925 [Deltaproteobacteria bacterium]